MPLDPELQPIVDLVNAVEPVPPSEDRVDEVRSAFALMLSMLGPGSADVEVRGRTVPGPAGDLPVRTYLPASAPEGDRAALVWFHGGGWVIGDLDTHDALCRDLAAASGAVVVSVGYRLAPEHRFPAAHDDAEAATEWVLAHAGELGVDPSRVAVGGDSAGGNLATVTARRLLARSAAGQGLEHLPSAQVLVYPVTDLAGAGEHASRTEHATGYLLTAEMMEFFEHSYVPDPARRSDPDASPLRAEDLSGLPPALVVVAELDPLRDEGLAYARRLEAADVPTTVRHLDGGVHLCAQMPGTTIGRAVVADVAGFLRSHRAPSR